MAVNNGRVNILDFSIILTIEFYKVSFKIIYLFINYKRSTIFI